MTTKMSISFSPPDISEKEIEEVIRALRSGWITTGPRTKEFEKRLASYLGADRVCCLASQTACAEMALRILGVGPGDEVIVPAYTYTASASVVCHVGATLVLIDSQPDSLEMDYDAVEAAINENTKAIIPVDLGGVPCDYDRIFRIVESKRSMFVPKGKVQSALGRVAVCADTAHALGAIWHGKPCGSIADFSSFSFHAVKNLTTAEGGCLAWKAIPGIDSDDLYEELQLLSLHGQSKDALAKTKLGAWDYDIIGPWYKCNMTDIQAAMGLAQLERYPEMLARRRQIIERYDSILGPLDVEVLDHYSTDRSSSGHLYICRVPDITLEQRNELIKKMAERGVATNVHYKPLPMHTAYKNLGFDIIKYPHAYVHFAHEVTLPLHTLLTDDEVEYVANCFVGCVHDVRGS